MKRKIALLSRVSPLVLIATFSITMGMGPLAFAKPEEGKRPPARSKKAKPPNGATAKCRDGTYSFSSSRRGLCDSHGGVDKFYDGSMFNP